MTDAKAGVVCGLCGDRLFSRSRHDFVVCGCGETFVDGGDDYLRYGGAAIVIEEGDDA